MVATDHLPRTYTYGELKNNKTLSAQDLYFVRFLSWLQYVNTKIDNCLYNIWQHLETYIKLWKIICIIYKYNNFVGRLWNSVFSATK